MRTLAEIEAAARLLSLEEKQELILFLVAQLLQTGEHLPPPREFTVQQVAAWVAEDEADLEAAWPKGFFDGIRISDDSFKRPAQR